VNVLFPNIVSIDVLLASLLLPMIMGVRLIAQGVEGRLRITRLSNFSIVLGRFIGDYLVALMQLLLIVLIAVFFFHVSTGNFPSFFIALLIAPAVFTSLGMLLAQFIQKESTAVLTSILINIPMIFLSGAILPIEFLKPPMDLLGRNLPMFHLTELFEKITVRGLTLIEGLPNFAALLLFVSVCLFLAYLARKIRE